MPPGAWPVIAIAGSNPTPDARTCKRTGEEVSGAQCSLRCEAHSLAWRRHCAFKVSVWLTAKRKKVAAAGCEAAGTRQAAESFALQGVR